ncbi:MAG: hypothetical protein A2283_24290 [Lentisphaerae bacterium RIFOXYA12_FULL_48_11]|nr:MAG: hypothetical protein A2283_24290 [Lentisphaerae bacterium RIFOXYA12_FULL_48_11]
MPKRKKKWTGSTPVKCDLCGNAFKKSDCFFDFKTNAGPWCLGCEQCFKTCGIGLGSGKGQKYSVATLERIQ